MRPVQKYITDEARILKNQFGKIRNAHKDSDVKGAGNERIVAEFIRRSLAPKRVLTNTSIIDANDRQSDEVDVAICNSDQPFIVDSPALLLAEGVDLVVQVKANLNLTEIRRIVRNCRTVKQLVRIHTPGDQVFGIPQPDYPFLVDRIPYICFAFDSIRLKTAASHFTEQCEKVPLEEQPDATFILDKGMILNARSGQGCLAHGESGFDVTELWDYTLLGLMRLLYVCIPTFRRSTSPLVHYLTSYPRPQTP